MILSPDGLRYWTPDPPRPYHLRPLVPFLCRQRQNRWRAVTYLSLAAIPILVVLLARQHDLTWAQAGVAGALVAGLPAARIFLYYPVLVDAPAMVLALGSALTVDVPPVSILLALLAGLTLERAPIFAALFAWHPLPLVGLAATLLVVAFRRPGPDPADPENQWIAEHPVKASRKYHRGRWRDPLVWLTPWGACLAGLVDPSSWVLATVGVAYAQTLVATDSVRLCQWAAPVLAVAAAGVIPPEWLLLAVVAHWLNPLAGVGP